MEIKFLKKKRKFRKGGLGIKPDLYWMCLLYMTFTLIFLSCAFGLYLFIEVNKEPIPTVMNMNVNEKGITEEERLTKALEYFSERKKKSIEILNSPSPIIDPSL